jgi:hypothetical protein
MQDFPLNREFVNYSLRYQTTIKGQLFREKNTKQKGKWNRIHFYIQYIKNKGGYKLPEIWMTKFDRFLNVTFV